MKSNDQGGSVQDQFTILSSETVIRGGTFEVGHDLTVRGALEGTVRVDGRIDVLQGARVEGSVTAREAIVAGCVSGDLKVTGTLVLRSSSEVTGAVQAAKIVFEDGAAGRLRMSVGSLEQIEGATARRERSRRELSEALARARAAVRKEPPPGPGSPPVQTAVESVVPAPQPTPETAPPSDTVAPTLPAPAVPKRLPAGTPTTDQLMESREMRSFLSHRDQPEPAHEEAVEGSGRK